MAEVALVRSLQSLSPFADVPNLTHSGNFGAKVNHGVEEVDPRFTAENTTTGRGGFGNVSEGPDLYDTSGGHTEATGMTGRGGFGNAPAHDTHGTTGTTEHGHAPPFKATTADKVIGT
jgi:hypothetical protein